MRMIGDMGFEIDTGACNTFVSNNEEFVLLCFTNGSQNKACHRWEEMFVKWQGSKISFFRFDGTSFSPSQPSTFMHERVTSIGNYRGQPFTSGGMAQTDTEILTISTDTWRSGTRYPWSGTDSTGWNIHVNQIFHLINKPFSDLHIIQRRQLVKDFTFSVVIWMKNAFQSTMTICGEIMDPF